MVYLFWCAVGFLVYTLVGYPILLSLFALVRARKHQTGDIQPSVTVIIVVHNASSLIGEKIKNTLAWDYPKEKLEILVGSDGSTDSTADIVRSFAHAGVKLVESKQWAGKHHVQKLAHDIARGEILVFTDAGIHVEPHVLARMVSHFADPHIGCVCSVDETRTARKSWVGEALYVYGEMGLRRLESQVSSLVSLSGAFFSVRRSMCDTWHADQSSDFFLALHAVQRGLRAILDPACPAQVGFVRSDRKELSRKMRTIVHGLVVLFSHISLLNPFRYGVFSWQVFSHKLCRWLFPFGVIAVLFANFFLWRAGLFYRVCLIGQLAAYAATLPFLILGRSAKLGIMRVISFFVLGNVATLWAWWKFFGGQKVVTWEPSQRG
jgi:glycosyltransferase involved in cell wall biosynthesis